MKPADSFDLRKFITEGRLLKEENTDQEILDQVRSELLSLFQPYGNFHVHDMTMKGQNTGTEFRVYANVKGANWKGLENFMRNNPDFTIKHVSKQTFDNPKAIDFSYKKSSKIKDILNKIGDIEEKIYNQYSDDEIDAKFDYLAAIDDIKKKYKDDKDKMYDALVSHLSKLKKSFPLK
jgi:hypothetical protein